MPKSTLYPLILFFVLTPLVCQGALVEYQIDLEGTLSRDSAHSLRAFGTITLDLSDPDPFDAVRSSKLFFQHEMDDPIPLMERPGDESVDAIRGLKWEAVDDKLYINRTSTANAILEWRSETVLGRVTNFFFEAGPPNNPHGLFYQLGTHMDTAILKPGGGPDGPQGFFVGVRVPEPSPIVFSMLLCVSIGTRRRRPTSHNRV